MEEDYRGWCESLVGLGEVEVVGWMIGRGVRWWWRCVWWGVRCAGGAAVGCGLRRSGGWCWWISRRFGGDAPGVVETPVAVSVFWCEVASFTEQAVRIAPARARVSSRAGQWATEQVGRRGRTAAEIAEELGCAWDTVDRAVDRWEEALLAADTDRVGAVDALRLDETLFQRRGRRNTRMWRTSGSAD